MRVWDPWILMLVVLSLCRFIQKEALYWLSLDYWSNWVCQWNAIGSISCHPEIFLSLAVNSFRFRILPQISSVPEHQMKIHFGIVRGINSSGQVSAYNLQSRGLSRSSSLDVWRCIGYCLAVFSIVMCIEMIHYTLFLSIELTIYPPSGLQNQQWSQTFWWFVHSYPAVLYCGRYNLLYCTLPGLIRTTFLKQCWPILFFPWSVWTCTGLHFSVHRTLLLKESGEQQLEGHQVSHFYKPFLLLWQGSMLALLLLVLLNSRVSPWLWGVIDPGFTDYPHDPTYITHHWVVRLPLQIASVII